MDLRELLVSLQEGNEILRQEPIFQSARLFEAENQIIDYRVQKEKIERIFELESPKQEIEDYVQPVDISYSRYAHSFNEYMLNKGKEQEVEQKQKTEDKLYFKTIKQLFKSLSGGGKEIRKEVLQNQLKSNIPLKLVLQQNSSLSLDEIFNKDSISKQDFLGHFGIQVNQSPKVLVKDGTIRRKPKLEKNYKITIPQPFSFVNRPKQQTVQQAKAEQKDKSKQFKANKVSPSIYNTTFDQVLLEKQEKSEQVKLASQALLQSLIKPFSFMEREEKKHSHNHQRPQSCHFKASEVPKTNKPGLYMQMVQKEKFKQNQRKQENYEFQCFSRMEQDLEDRKIVKKSKPEKKQRFKAKQVPDFKYLHQTFQEQLKSTRQQKQKTIPEPFNLHKGTTTCKCTNYIAPLIKKRVKSLKRFQQSENDPYITLKVKQMFELTQQKLEQERKKIYDYQIEQFRKKQKQKLLKAQLQSSPFLRDSNMELEQRRAQLRSSLAKNMKAAYHNYENQKIDIDDRVMHRPLLLESV